MKGLILIIIVIVIIILIGHFFTKCQDGTSQSSNNSRPSDNSETFNVTERDNFNIVNIEREGNDFFEQTRVVSPIVGEVDSNHEALVPDAFLVVSHHISGCFNSTNQIYLAIRKDGSGVYNNKELVAGTISDLEIKRIHKLMMENDFFNRSYDVTEYVSQSTTKTYDVVYYTDGKIFAELKCAPTYITDLIRSLELRFGLKVKTLTEPIGKFVY